LAGKSSKGVQGGEIERIEAFEDDANELYDA
jgi:hypothetical protein